MKPNGEFFDNANKDLRDANDVMRQQIYDYLSIAMNEEFGFGKDRLLRMFKKLADVEDTYSKIVSDDDKDDKKIIYAKDKIDERLRQIYGPDYPEFDVRYGFNISRKVHVHTKKHHGKKKRR